MMFSCVPTFSFSNGGCGCISVCVWLDDGSFGRAALSCCFVVYK